MIQYNFGVIEGKNGVNFGLYKGQRRGVFWAPPFGVVAVQGKGGKRAEFLIKSNFLQIFFKFFLLCIALVFN